MSSFQGLRQIRARIPLAHPERGMAYLNAGLPSDRSTSWSFVIDALKASGVDIAPGRGPAYLRDLGFTMRQFSELDPECAWIWTDFDPFRRAGSDGAGNGLLDNVAPFNGPAPPLSEN